MKIALLASGRGSNARALMKAKAEGRLPACEFVCLITNMPGAGVLEAAAEFGVPGVVVPHRGLKRRTHEERVIAELERRDVEGVVLAGYMRILTPLLIERFPQRILNIHPALLPAFPGVDGQGQAFDYGVKIAGCTVHFVDTGVDSGPIILQAAVPVEPGDTRDDLAARILVEEHRIFPLAVDLFTRGKLRIDGRTVRVLS